MVTKFTKIAAAVMAASFGFSNSVHAQTLTFTQEDVVNWSDGIAEDGDGGSVNINGITLQIYEGANRTSNTQFTGSTMIWRNATWFASQNGFTGITAGPDIAVTNAGMPSFIIKSASQAVNFNLTAIQLLDWGGIAAKMEAYDNGTLKGSINLNLPSDGNSKTFTAADELVASTFVGIDELRIIPLTLTDTAIWVGLNNLTISSTPLPIDFINVNARLNNDNTVSLDWQTGSAQKTQSFEIEKSADGKNFESVGMLRDHIKDNTQFHFTSLPIFTSSYFRIKETDNAGSISYSKVVWVQMQALSGSIVWYPNPAKDNLTIRSENEILRVRILDFSGKEVYAAPSYSKHVVINTAALSKGMYIIKIKDAAGNEKSDRFVKQ
jgi:hypothetical protein